MREFFERWAGANLDRSKNKKYRVKDSILIVNIIGCSTEFDSHLSAIRSNNYGRL